MKKVLGSPHSIIWSYFSLLRNLSYHSTEITDTNEKRENNLLIILMAVTVVETFYNIYFSLLVSDKKYQKHREKILKDVKNPNFSFEKKLKEWPILLFDKNIQFGAGIGQKFSNLKNLRNKLLHFLPEYKNIEFSNIKIESVVDISIYNDLDKFDATNCPSMILDFISELFILANCPKEKVGHQIHIWFGNLSRIKLTQICQ